MIHDLIICIFFRRLSVEDEQDVSLVRLLVWWAKTFQWAETLTCQTAAELIVLTMAALHHMLCVYVWVWVCATPVAPWHKWDGAVVNIIRHTCDFFSPTYSSKHLCCDVWAAWRGRQEQRAFKEANCCLRPRLRAQVLIWKLLVEKNRPKRNCSALRRWLSNVAASEPREQRWSGRR